MVVTVAGMIAMLSACTTYHASGMTGGFSETQLNATTYQIRFQGNGFTAARRVDDYLLRRAAELSLEHGYRHFLIVGREGQDRYDMGVRFPERVATVRFVRPATSDAVDAVLIVEQTDDIAGGRLSTRAREAMASLK